MGKLLAWRAEWRNHSGTLVCWTWVEAPDAETALIMARACPTDARARSAKAMSLAVLPKAAPMRFEAGP